MFFIRSVMVVLFIEALVLLCGSGCSDSGNPAGESTREDTSKFIGTWVSVFDTSDNPPGTKDDKLMFWCMGGTCGKPDTFLFVNDTLYRGYKSGFEFYYRYTDDSIFFYSTIVGTDERVLEEASPYYLSNDTLLFDYDTMTIAEKMYINRPVSIRISDTLLQ